MAASRSWTGMMTFWQVFCCTTVAAVHDIAPFHLDHIANALADKEQQMQPKLQVFARLAQKGHDDFVRVHL